MILLPNMTFTVMIVFVMNGYDTYVAIDKYIVAYCYNMAQYSTMLLIKHNASRDRKNIRILIHKTVWIVSKFYFIRNTNYEL